MRWTEEQLRDRLKSNKDLRIDDTPIATPSTQAIPAHRMPVESSQGDQASKMPRKKERTVRGAQKSVDEQGRKFDSKLERYMAEELDRHNISYEFQRTFLLQEKFRFHSELIRPVTVKIDFFFPQFNLLADTKGFQTHESKLRYKLLKKLLMENPNPPKLVMPRVKKEVDQLVIELLSKTTLDNSRKQG